MKVTGGRKYLLTFGENKHLGVPMEMESPPTQIGLRLAGCGSQANHYARDPSTF